MSALKFTEAVDIAVGEDNRLLVKKLIADAELLRCELNLLRKRAHVRCEHCGDMYELMDGHASPHGFFCSEDCYDHAMGERAEDNYAYALICNERGK